MIYFIGNCLTLTSSKAQSLVLILYVGYACPYDKFIASVTEPLRASGVKCMWRQPSIVCQIHIFNLATSSYNFSPLGPRLLTVILTINM